MLCSTVYSSTTTNLLQINVNLLLYKMRITVLEGDLPFLTEIVGLGGDLCLYYKLN